LFGLTGVTDGAGGLLGLVTVPPLGLVLGFVVVLVLGDEEPEEDDEELLSVPVELDWLFEVVVPLEAAVFTAGCVNGFLERPVRGAVEGVFDTVTAGICSMGGVDAGGSWAVAAGGAEVLLDSAIGTATIPTTSSAATIARRLLTRPRATRSTTLGTLIWTFTFLRSLTSMFLRSSFFFGRFTASPSLRA
jgi:hypothetical protein